MAVSPTVEFWVFKDINGNMPRRHVLICLMANTMLVPPKAELVQLSLHQRRKNPVEEIPGHQKIVITDSGAGRRHLHVILHIWIKDMFKLSSKNLVFDTQP
jgi:hypothetical protein